ncbi:MAG: hypothetical protein K2X82_28220 [Gemmataceae bacterium]|nr:hypothetical protein [Gemmataceae bacterium]
MTNPAAPPLPLAEVTHRAIRVLSRELGPADAARFVGQFSGGSGDYTAERDGLFAGRTVAELAADIRAAVAAGRPPHTAAVAEQPAAEPGR